MESRYKKTVALMAAFNSNDESAVVAGKEAESETTTNPVQQTGQNTNFGKE